MIVRRLLLIIDNDGGNNISNVTGIDIISVMCAPVLFFLLLCLQNILSKESLLWFSSVSGA